MPAALSSPLPGCVHSLSAPELFTLTCLRGWVEKLLHPQNDAPDWRRGFVMAGLPLTSARAFDAFLTLVSRHALRPLDVRTPKCFCLSADERHFLAMIASAQEGDGQSVLRLMAEWLPPACARHGVIPLSAFAGAMAARHLNLAVESPDRSAEPTAASVLGTATLH